LQKLHLCPIKTWAANFKYGVSSHQCPLRRRDLAQADLEEALIHVVAAAEK
jgi:hypothetical protein